MRGWKHWVLVAISAAGILSSCGGGSQQNNMSPDNNELNNVLPEPEAPATMTINEAESTGAAGLTASGVDLQHVRFTVTAQRPLHVTIPAGCMLTSADAGTQNMVTAELITMHLLGTPDAPLTQSVDVPAYCINRYRETPHAEASFALGEPNADTQPVQELARCLESTGATHEERQFAVWAISDRFAYMTPDQFVQEGIEHSRAQMLGLGPERLADWIQSRNPQADVSRIRAIPIDDFPAFVEQLVAGFEPIKRREFEEMRAAARPLLERCRPDFANMPMFAGG